MTALTILAGGHGTRLFGKDGGNKAMSYIGPSQRLIDYVVSEAHELSINLIRVIIPEGDNSTEEYLRKISIDAYIECIRKATINTGDAVTRLLSKIDANHIILTPCDIAGPRGALCTFFKQAITSVDNIGQHVPVCVMAVTECEGNEDKPIYVHHENGFVTQYSKVASPCKYVSTGVRVMNAAFAKLFISLYHNGLTDTMTMSECVKHFPKSVLAIPAPNIFDVDNYAALKRARALLSINSATNIIQ